MKTINRFIQSFRWKYLLLLSCLTYFLIFYIPHPTIKTDDGEISLIIFNTTFKSKLKYQWIMSDSLNSAESILTSSNITLQDRLNCNVVPGEKRLIVSWNAGHSQRNLRGCPDWNCEFSTVRSKASKADAVLFAHYDIKFKRKPNQYLVYFSQESPVNSIIRPPQKDYFNMTLGFRHDTPASSPYGYTIKYTIQQELLLRNETLIDYQMIRNKNKTAAWFVSHCTTNSKRETLVDKIKEYIQVDVFGKCGNLKCPKKSGCENKLNTDYLFYFSFENSICKDYITEKLWQHGYKQTVVPIVLKRSIVEPYVPPNSFIAVDDFKSVKELTDYLLYLKSNLTAYTEYFNWRYKYKVIFLDGTTHNLQERPWGFCQLCRLLWTKPRQTFIIEDFNEYWTSSCEDDGHFVNSFLS